ncbi:SCP2 sterol-binding domain-containing protein [Haloechinothrix salitolerans]|uniref:SCP2 sterol-binding domain-containing protein n=1 Tax=Haloechinothrix salitolerans TaxID=926830 RepID=A0ABW2BUB6_9PSEU
MATPVLSPEWMKSYAELWNETEATREGLKKLSMVIEYRLAEDEGRAGQIEVVEGEVVRAGAPADGVKPEYVLTAKADTWKRLGAGEIPAAKAMVTRKVKFRGPMSVALAHLPSLEAAMRMFGQIDTDWSA